jgi:hypothetical protein
MYVVIAFSIQCLTSQLFADAHPTDRKSEVRVPQKLRIRRIQSDSSKMATECRYYAGKGQKVNKLADLPSLAH